MLYCYNDTFVLQILIRWSEALRGDDMRWGACSCVSARMGSTPDSRLGQDATFHSTASIDTQSQVH